MQYTLVDLLRPEHIMVGLEAADAQQAIQALSGLMVQSGHAGPEFAADVWEREQTFPTGLPTQPVAIAIPHADPFHVNQSAVSMGILKTPVLFGQMGTDGSVHLDAKVVFLLAIKEREKQVEMIQQLITLIQSADLLAGITHAEDADQVLELIRHTLSS
jgi:PTS system galactitol-specific IIA component